MDRAQPRPRAQVVSSTRRAAPKTFLVSAGRRFTGLGDKNFITNRARPKPGSIRLRNRLRALLLAIGLLDLSRRELQVRPDVLDLDLDDGALLPVGLEGPLDQLSDNENPRSLAEALGCVLGD